MLATRNTKIGRLWLLLWSSPWAGWNGLTSIIWLMHSPYETVALCRKHGTVLQTHGLLSAATFDLISFTIFLFWLYLNHTGLFIIPGTPWTLSCPRTFACALFCFFLKSSWLEFLTFVQISDEMSWERMSHITLFRIKPIPIPSSPPPRPALFFFKTLNVTRHCLFPLEEKFLERLLFPLE